MIASVNKQGAALPREVLLIAQRLNRELHPDAIYLFGSHARGESGPDSDLDFLVVVSESSDARYVRGVRARATVGDIAAAKDIIVMTRKEWDAERSVVCSLASTVAREGIRLDQ